MASTLDKAKAARESFYLLSKTKTEVKNRALSAIAQALSSGRADILKANEIDCSLAEGNITNALYDRLKLTERKIDTIIEGVKSVAKLEDPVGKTLSAIELDSGFELYKISVPIGVIGVVFESRPDVLVQISTLCLKSGNAVILKGGSEAKNTNRTLYELISKTCVQNNIASGWIQLVESRAEVFDLLKLDEYIDLMIPRGSNEFVKQIQDNTKIPVLGHASGICHVYVDRKADMSKAVGISFDAKCQYPAVCNAMETLLIHKDIAAEFLPAVWELYSTVGVKGKGNDKARKILPEISAASEKDWRIEYNNLELNIKVVESVQEAVDHINEYGSHHTDAIVTEDEQTGKYFTESVDSSSVMWNASTRFADGFRYGLGSEVGISTNKIHARGPVGLEGLTTHKWILKGNGHKVADYKDKKYAHRKIKKTWLK